MGLGLGVEPWSPGLRGCEALGFMLGLWSEGLRQDAHEGVDLNGPKVSPARKDFKVRGLGFSVVLILLVRQQIMKQHSILHTVASVS